MAEDLLEKLANAVVALDIQAVEIVSKMALDAGIPPLVAINQGLSRGMARIGSLYSSGKIYIPELICGADTMNAGLEVLYSKVLKNSSDVKGTVVIGVVEGDTHDIGKNIVAMMLKVDGYEVIDLGINVPLSRFVDVAKETSADIIALSSLLTTTMDSMETVIKDCHTRCTNNRPLVIVGGAPVTQSFASQIGADGYADNAMEAVERIWQLIGVANGQQGEKETLLDYIGQKKHRAIMPWMSNVGLRLTGYELYEVYQSPEKQLEVAKAMDETFPTEFIYPICYGKIFCEALEIPLLRSSHDFPSVVESLIINDEKLSQYSVPNPEKDGLMPVYVESLRLLANHFSKPLMIPVEGPFTLAMELSGATNFARAIIRDPGFVNRILEFTVETVSTYIHAAVAAGVQLVIISEPSSIMLSPQRFEQLVCPALRRIFGSFDGWKGLHICGDSTHILDQMLNCGAECLSLDQLVDIPAIASKIPPNIVICGNIDPLGVLKEKTPDEIKEITIAQLKNMKNYSNYMVSFGCDCLPDTPLENLKAVIEAGHAII